MPVARGNLRSGIAKGKGEIRGVSAVRGSLEFPFSQSREKASGWCLRAAVEA